MAECGSMCKIEVNVNLVVKERLEAPRTILPDSDVNLSLMGLYRGHSNLKCALFSIAL